VAEQQRVDMAMLPLRVGLFGAEPWSEPLRREIEARLGIVAFDTYGLSEVIGPGVAQECEYHQGLHINEDHFIPEIIDPESGVPMGDDAAGELVLTAISKEAMPLLRYRTRDRTRLIREPCVCGRSTVRMARVLGRTDDMLVVDGVSVFPSQIEPALLWIGGVAPHYQLIVDRERGALDQLELRVEAPVGLASNAERRYQLERRLRDGIQSRLDITCMVQIVAPGEIERSEGKAVPIVDKHQASKSG
jgi:phenylacetate-CoA ligase